MKKNVFFLYLKNLKTQKKKYIQNHKTQKISLVQRVSKISFKNYVSLDSSFRSTYGGAHLPLELRGFDVSITVENT